jgi:transposase-like protein
MPRQYPTGFRDELVQRMLGGEPVLAVRDDTGVPEQTLHRCKHQAFIDAGLVDGIDSTQSAALRAAHKRINFLEEELELVKDASEIYDSLAVVDPKGGRPSR